jgi:hypothetical protein
MNNFFVTIVFSGDHGVDLEKQDGETVNFLAEGDTKADHIIRRHVVSLANALKEYKHTELVSATLTHSNGLIDDNLITGVRRVLVGFDDGEFDPAEVEDVIVDSGGAIVLGGTAIELSPSTTAEKPAVE